MEGLGSGARVGKTKNLDQCCEAECQAHDTEQKTEKTGIPTISKKPKNRDCCAYQEKHCGIDGKLNSVPGVIAALSQVLCVAAQHILLFCVLLSQVWVLFGRSFHNLDLIVRPTFRGLNPQFKRSVHLKDQQEHTGGSEQPQNHREENISVDL